jgi:hypothetical protein
MCLSKGAQKGLYYSLCVCVCVCVCVCRGQVGEGVDICKLYACWRLTKPNTVGFPLALPSMLESDILRVHYIGV